MYSKYFTSYLPYQPPSAFNRVLPLPPVSESELHGQLLDWASQYLYSKQFPWNLITILLKQLRKEFDKLDFHNPKTTEIDGVIWYNAISAKQLIIDKVDELCLKYAVEYNPEVLDVNLKQPFCELSCISFRNARRTLEDRFCIVPSLDHVFDIPVPTSYFAVFDGHDGSEAANYSAAQLHVNLINLDSFPSNIEEAVNKSFHITDENFLVKCATTDHKSGTTLAVTLFIGDKLYVAWAGDSQVMVVRGSTGVDSLVVPHKPGRLDEIERISNLGGDVSRYDSTDVWRVNGCLAVSRAIGDPEFKKFVISTPDIVDVPLDGTEEYLILATDGLWDDVTPERCRQLVESHLISELCHERVCVPLVEEAKCKGSKDNTTIIVLFMKPVKDLITKYINASTTLSASDKSNRLDQIAALEVLSKYSPPHEVTDDNGRGRDADAPFHVSEEPKSSARESSSSGCLI